MPRDVTYIAVRRGSLVRQRGPTSFQTSSNLTRVKPGSPKVNVKLTKAGFKLLKKGTLKTAKVVIYSRDIHGDATDATGTVKLKAPKVKARTR